VKHANRAITKLAESKSCAELAYRFVSENLKAILYAALVDCKSTSNQTLVTESHLNSLFHNAFLIVKDGYYQASVMGEKQKIQNHWKDCVSFAVRSVFYKIREQVAGMLSFF
jgi:hypothetical protein